MNPNSKNIHLENDVLYRRVVGAAQLFTKTQRDAALRRLAAIRAVVVQFWSYRTGQKKVNK